MNFPSTRTQVAIGAALMISLMLASSFPITQAHAQEDTPKTSITIAPSILEISVQPSETLIQTVSITNHAEIPLPTQVEVTDYSMDEHGLPDYSDDVTGWSSKDWIVPDVTDIILEPQETRQVGFTIIVPEKARVGSHIATVLFKPVFPPDYFDPHSSHIIPYIGALIALNVHTDEDLSPGEFLDIQNFTSDTSDKEKGVVLSAEIYNKDVYYHRPEGTISIFNILNTKVHEQSIDNVTILPQKVRDISNTLSKDLDGGKYRAEIRIGENDVTATDTTEFWVTPSVGELIRVVVIFILLLLLLTGLYLLIRNRRNLRKALKVLMRGKE